ncbi:SusC/RagA family TonB-linked outer membrane protein [Negadavirga shengliensis]|uniref:SusC/RagA family TonB-linked outer membrane protein n=1 Tax=Negadavirga shengliensis TaxID=1389218 RepID=A0ABV9T0V0_9BACT
MKKILLHHAGGADRTFSTISCPESDLHHLNPGRDKASSPSLTSIITKFMRWSVIIIGIICCTAITLIAGDVKGQSPLETIVTVNIKNEPLKAALDQISKVSGVKFMYSDAIASSTVRVSVGAEDSPLREVLEHVFTPIPYSYRLVGEEILVRHEPGKLIQQKNNNQVPNPLPEVDLTVSGTVTDTTGLPLPGVTVQVKGTNKGTVTDDEGMFTLNGLENDATLQFRMLGFYSQEIHVGNREVINVMMKERLSELDEAVVIGYGTTTKRFNTGAVSTVTSEELSKQPTNNILGALSGRIPGLLVTQSSGAPGSSFDIQIRGQNSIAQGSEPLILIDGIPFSPGNENINTMVSSIGASISGGGLSPFNSINPNDIERIEVLKDADATAIYGSRGANGVILITTKKGHIGKTQITVNVNQGITQAQKGVPLLNTAQYLEMRQEAFLNSNIEPNINNAPDLVAWDQNRYTDLQNELVGNMGHVTNAQLSVSGGNEGTQFLLGGGYYRETNVFPDKLDNNRGSVNANINHNSSDKRFQLTFSGSYTATTNNSPGQDLTFYTFLPPNVPSFFDEWGSLKWEEHGTNYDNPYRYLFNKYKANTGNLMSSLNLNYSILSSLNFKVLMGYNELNANDMKLFPKSFRPPTDEQPSTAQFGNTQYKGWNIEPQLEYIAGIWKGELNVLAGGTFQEKLQTGSFLNLSGFPSDALLESAQAASNVVSQSSTNILYRYQAVFGRINYNVQNKYLVNITGRRDGSSRFGPGQQYANFGAIGAAWIFTGENWLKNSPSLLSYGKLRGSYGITGNDQIGDYQYLDAWGSFSSNSYQNTSTLQPLNLFNPTYGWEENRKLEFAIELGFWNDRLLLSADFFRNTSSNQLVMYRLPYMTGFGSITNNFPASVENKGWEIQLNGEIFKNQNFQWNGSFNITVPRNTLLDFPDIESSTYASLYEVGNSLNSIYNYRSLGVNPETGLFSLLDVNEDGFLFPLHDNIINGNLDPKYFGGFRNTLRYKGLELDMFFDYRKQMGRNALYWMYENNRTPGTFINQPLFVLGRWISEGDHAEIEKFLASTNFNNANIARSSAVFSDQSFIRLRSIHFSYSLPQLLLSAIKAKNVNIYFQGQNLYTWNNDKGYDPENQSLYNLGPLKSYIIGVQFTY